MQIQISWLLQKPTYLDLYCLQKQGISGFSRTRVKKNLLNFHLYCHLTWWHVHIGQRNQAFAISESNEPESGQHKASARADCMNTRAHQLLCCFYMPQRTSLLIATNPQVVGTHNKHLIELLLMSTHNICFHGEIRKIFTGYPFFLQAISILHYSL